MIIRTEKNANYSVLSNVALNDGELSFKAAGVYAYLMSKPNNWKISIAGIASQRNKDGKDAIRAALVELEEAGYLVRGKQIRNEDGTFTVSDSVLRESTALDYPTTGNPMAGNPTQVSTDKVNTEIDIIHTQNKLVQKDPNISTVQEHWVGTFGRAKKFTSADDKACARLVKEYGLDKVMNYIVLAKAGRGVQYAPVITNFKELESKWDRLEAWGMRTQSQRLNRSVTITE